MSPTPFRIPEPESRNVATICGAVRIVGRIFAKEDIYLDGDVEGRIESPDSTITIGPNGRVHADIRACEVVILGSVTPPLWLSGPTTVTVSFLPLPSVSLRLT